MIHVAAFSGGKDSTALLLWLREQGIPFTAVFCDTGWEHPLTYAYVEEINQRLLDGALVTLKPDGRWGDMRGLIAAKGTIPSARRRFCTQYLKVEPMQAWLAAQPDETTLYQGIRAEESNARAAMAPSEWSDVYDCRVERPLFRWRAAEVFAIAERYGIAPNPLYRLGSKRVGCFPCVMTRHAELKRLDAMLPEVWERIAELETIAGSSFFPPEYIPARYCTTVSPKGNGIPTVAEVRRYLSDANQSQLDGDGETPACLSVYNLCE